MNRNPDTIPGWFDFGGIYDYVVRRAPVDRRSVFVEIGTAYGRSAAVMATFIEASGKPILFYTIDSFDSKDPGVMTDIAYRINDLKLGTTFQAIARRFLTPYPEAELIVGKSCEVAYLFTHTPIDFLFIDGDHELAGIRSDLDAWLPKMRSGSIIAGHDWDTPGVSTAVRERFGDMFTVVNGSWITTV